MMQLIHIGSRFYYESGSVMGSLYTPEGERSDWGKVELTLERGDSVTLRPATDEELKPYEKRLAEVVQEWNSRK